MDTEQNQFFEVQQVTFLDYVRIIRYYLTHVLLIVSVGIAAVVIYALISINIYSSQTQIKISKPQASILESPVLMPDLEANKNDRFIATEIIRLKSKNFESRVAAELLDSMKEYDKSRLYSLLVEPPHKAHGVLRQKTLKQIVSVLKSTVKVDQVKGVDIIEVEVQSPSPDEAVLIANCYNSVYLQVSQETNRSQLTMTRDFLSKQREEKSAQLNQAENNLKNYQEEKGFVSLDDQSSTLINQLSEIESKINLTKIDLGTSNNNIKMLRAEIQKRDPKVVEYLESTVSEEYIKSAQTEIARTQLQMDLAKYDNAAGKMDPRVAQKYESKINELQANINTRIQSVKNGLMGSGVDELKTLSGKLLEQEIQSQSLKIQMNELNSINANYERRFNELPKASIEFADLKRKQESLEKLFNLIEQKYQEALVNEQSQPGYISIIENPEKPTSPSKPNRVLIIFAGIFTSILLSLIYAFLRNYFDNTVKSPEEIERRQINLISWIPTISDVAKSLDAGELVVALSPKARASEAFKVLKTRIQYSKMKEGNIKSILITSSIPGEGKTTIAANLAASFALSGFKSIIVDADLRKPRIHSLFKAPRTPGLVDNLFGKSTFEEIVYKTVVTNLSYIPCGTIPPNPTEILQSPKFKELLEKLHKEYDYIIIDSPPEIVVTDVELISRLVDVTVLVAFAGLTRVAILERVVRQFEKNIPGFAGVVLNNFNVDNAYGSYYKYYYYYGQNSDNRPPKKGS